MFTHETKIRVRYGETDQMGYMYYGNYASFYEVGRVEMLRSLGLTYKGMEASGIMLPVLELRCKYIKPAFYDEEIRVKIILEKLPGIRIHFTYELYNEQDELINIGETTLVFVDMKKNKPCNPPEDFIEKLKPYF
ncbi:acyl-CoA thioesterase [Pedobacter sp. BS3]|uniref:acyl-CoA thioesterase n=1 Tax=Pedobacter sp. BS3 TaxID=2567937 RepID=UPI0011EF6224|nr:thioesterase family protein [Pedobacter sp. BS3]TZF83687.1 acyl-CoA thioesterase [Pedobacter sp. BS3]